MLSDEGDTSSSSSENEGKVSSRPYEGPCCPALKVPPSSPVMEPHLPKQQISKKVNRYNEPATINEHFQRGRKKWKRKRHDRSLKSSKISGEANLKRLISMPNLRNKTTKVFQYMNSNHILQTERKNRILESLKLHMIKITQRN